MKIRLMQVLWVAMWIVFLGFLITGIGIGRDALFMAPITGALIAGIGFSIVYVVTGSFRLPK